MDECCQSTSEACSSADWPGVQLYDRACAASSGSSKCAFPSDRREKSGVNTKSNSSGVDVVEHYAAAPVKFSQIARHNNNNILNIREKKKKLRSDLNRISSECDQDGLSGRSSKDLRGAKKRSKYRNGREISNVLVSDTDDDDFVEPKHKVPPAQYICENSLSGKYCQTMPGNSRSVETCGTVLSHETPRQFKAELPVASRSTQSRCPDIGPSAHDGDEFGVYSLVDSFIDDLSPRKQCRNKPNRGERSHSRHRTKKLRQKTIDEIDSIITFDVLDEHNEQVSQANHLEPSAASSITAVTSTRALEGHKPASNSRQSREMSRKARYKTAGRSEMLFNSCEDFGTADVDVGRENLAGNALRDLDCEEGCQTAETAVVDAIFSSAVDDICASSESNITLTPYWWKKPRLRSSLCGSSSSANAREGSLRHSLVGSCSSTNPVVNRPQESVNSQCFDTIESSRENSTVLGQMNAGRHMVTKSKYRIHGQGIADGDTGAENAAASATAASNNGSGKCYGLRSRASFRRGRRILDDDDDDDDDEELTLNRGEYLNSSGSIAIHRAPESASGDVTSYRDSVVIVDSDDEETSATGRDHQKAVGLPDGLQGNVADPAGQDGNSERSLPPRRREKRTARMSCVGECRYLIIIIIIINRHFKTLN